MIARRAVSIDRLVPSLEILDRVSTLRSRISGGWSHSWEMPISRSAAPREQMISVAEGSNETMRARVRDMVPIEIAAGTTIFRPDPLVATLLPSRGLGNREGRLTRDVLVSAAMVD